MAWMNLVMAVTALGAAVAMRPWRGLTSEHAPWPWLAALVLMPVLWSADRAVQSAMVQPLSGACLLMLMCGWPLGVLALGLVTLLTWWLGDLQAAEALRRGVWLGIVPATIAMAAGAGIRRWLPAHLMVYILGRGFFATLLANALARAADLTLHDVGSTLTGGELMVGRWLASWADALITGMLTAVFVAFRPQWLATYADRLYLPR
jgi:uncharacterized membrane protein